MVLQRRGLSRSSLMFTPPNSSPTSFDAPSNENRKLVEPELSRLSLFLLQPTLAALIARRRLQESPILMLFERKQLFFEVKILQKTLFCSLAEEVIIASTILCHNRTGIMFLSRYFGRTLLAAAKSDTSAAVAAATSSLGQYATLFRSSLRTYYLRPLAILISHEFGPTEASFSSYKINYDYQLLWETF
ncbi:hypothetical protein L484_004945 [Morus notabilis]|uniref:Uncharacterized protein n=1 Tax=Morus notabilis TaxID=981085 RepID=W9SWN4_9ROSA|nr:hypothetical protein L484_004945 [Morus notabilis]